VLLFLILLLPTVCSTGKKAKFLGQNRCDYEDRTLQIICIEAGSSRRPAIALLLGSNSICACSERDAKG
jgi:hypothetical protein